MIKRKIKEIIGRIISCRLYNGTPIADKKFDWRPFHLAKRFSAPIRLWLRVAPGLETCPGPPAGAAGYITICTKFHSSLKP